jgi:hypothetical protein
MKPINRKTMHTKIRLMAMILMALMISVQVFAGKKDFEGVMVYNITYPDSKLDAQTMASMPKTMKITVKGDMSKTEMSLGMGNTSTIFNAADETSTTLLEMMGQKFAIKMSKEDIEKENAKMQDYSVEQTDETKDIAGYSCKKVLITYTQDGKTTTQEAWFTEELGEGAFNATNPIFKDIKGTLLEFTVNESGMTMTMTAVSVDKKKISDKEFDIPEGYKEVTQEELQSMFGG